MHGTSKLLWCIRTGGGRKQPAATAARTCTSSRRCDHERQTLEDKLQSPIVRHGRYVGRFNPGGGARLGVVGPAAPGSASRVIAVFSWKTDLKHFRPLPAWGRPHARTG